MQEVNGHLVRVVRDRLKNILIECGMLVDEIVQVNVAEGGQGDTGSNDLILNLKKVNLRLREK